VEKQRPTVKGSKAFQDAPGEANWQKEKSKRKKTRRNERTIER